MKKFILFLTVCFISGLGLHCYAQSQAEIAFEKIEHDFGKIKEEGGPAVYDFKFTNKGKVPLIISSVNASCGCTTPEWSKEPIKKKKKGQIVVTYDTQRIGNFNKTISVFTDRQDNPVQLQIKGNVLPPVEGDPNYDEYQKKQSDKKQINKDPNGKQIQKADDKKLEEKPNK